MSKQMQVFSPELLTATKFNSAEQKAQWGNALVRFVMAGFPRNAFTKNLYNRLSLCFGHIAHTSQGGFYATWFSDSRQQMEWVKHILGYTPCGSPEFTYCDVERQFKAWLAVNKKEVEEIILQNLQKEEDASKAESARKAALNGKRTQQYKVAAMSSNTGDFGHTQFVMLAQDGSCWKVHHIQGNGAWHKGQVFDVSLDKHGNPTWEGMNVEVPQRCETIPADVVAKFWDTEAA